MSKKLSFLERCALWLGKFITQEYKRGNNGIKFIIRRYYLNKIQGQGMTAQNVIFLIQLGDQNLIDLYFKANALEVWNNPYYEPVIQYLEEERGREEEYRRRYFECRFRKK